jgi:hypothetical protein
MALTDAELVQWMLSIDVTIAGSAAMARVPLANLRGYLEKRGWRRVYRDTRNDTWATPDDRESYAIPNSEGFDGYAARMQHILIILTQHENRSPLAILAEIMGYLPTENSVPTIHEANPAALSEALAEGLVSGQAAEYPDDGPAKPETVTVELTGIVTGEANAPGYHRVDVTPTGVRVVGVDPAKSGSDATVTATVDGGKIVDLQEEAANQEPPPPPPYDDDPDLSAALVREPEKAAAVVCVPDGATTPDPEMRRAHEIIGGALAGTLKAVEDALEETGAKPAGPLQITTQRTEDGQTEITATLRTVRGRPLVAPPEWPEKPKVHCDGCIWRQDRGLCFCPGLCIRDVAGEILPRPVWVTNPDRDCQHWEKREE